MRYHSRTSCRVLGQRGKRGKFDRRITAKRVFRMDSLDLLRRMREAHLAENPNNGSKPSQASRQNSYTSAAAMAPTLYSGAQLRTLSAGSKRGDQIERENW